MSLSPGEPARERKVSLASTDERAAITCVAHVFMIHGAMEVNAGHTKLLNSAVPGQVSSHSNDIRARKTNVIVATGSICYDHFALP
jgi:hypothetical protein